MRGAGWEGGGKGGVSFDACFWHVRTCVEFIKRCLLCFVCVKGTRQSIVRTRKKIEKKTFRVRNFLIGQFFSGQLCTPGRSCRFCRYEMLCRICRVNILPRKLVLDDADHTAPTRQQELDHTDYTDHEYIYLP